ncbi:flagellar assembly protein FliW [Gracilibacillus caseinilyticus]|uniref:Flagellar assembly factor FliW n=1 Tax=Gracilibacillus caseinilyticus TaxID=2932256 RepID=A0ABY4EWF9_9BACI|nr:flagellar assembly protein FliW [Gracilibacillus caseinilyticus]UOQ48305.1 flagellar assembly protein FliW [Gracilibacillus caseinilyticus]
MKIATKYFGETEINDNEIIHFPNGLPGFVDEKEFVLLSFEENGLFQVLQSSKGENPAFVVVNPFLFIKDYEFKLDDTVLEQLEIKDQNDVFVITIVTVKDSLSSSTANLHAPVVINQREKLGKQYITKQSKYSTREQIFLSSKVEEE